MKYSRLEPVKISSNDITRTIFLDILFLFSWYKFDFPLPQPWIDFNGRTDDLRRQSSEIYMLENFQSHSLNPRISLLKSV